MHKLRDDINNNKINHFIDGIIFTPIAIAVGKKTQYSLFKWKQKHTFDFKIVESPKEIYAQVNERRQLANFGAVEINTEYGKAFKQDLEKLKHYTNGCIVECSYDSVTGHFHPLLVRTGKKHPNGLYTVERTLDNIREDITLESLVEISKRKKGNSSNNMSVTNKSTWASIIKSKT